MADRFPGIARAAFSIALDNGGINRNRSEKQQRRDFNQFIDRQPPEILADIDAWLSSLTDDELETACTGEQTEMDDLLSGSPPFTDKLLNDYFNEVC